MSLTTATRELVQTLREFPWRTTGQTLLTRFREDRLGLNASSLTFTTVVSLVPFFTVLLAVFSAFPAFGKLQGVLQQWLADSLFPEAIARQVIGYLTQFASKASRVGAIGFGFLLVTAISLILTIDRTLNGIWRVQRKRPLAQRVLMYWAVLTLGPLLLAGSLALTSYAMSASRGLVGALPAPLRLGLDVFEFALMACGMAALYRFVPNTQVAWRHALVGGVFVSIGLELAKRGLALYLGKMPSFSVIYGAFATIPILLLWIYIVWLVVLLGAVVVAYLPSLMSGVSRKGGTPGLRFQLAVETLLLLESVRAHEDKGLTSDALARRLHVDPLALEPVIGVLSRLDWISQLEDRRLVLLVDLDHTAAGPLVQALLLADGAATAPLVDASGLSRRSIRGALVSESAAA